MEPLPRLELMLADMEGADPLFRPTNFWDTGLVSIVEDLRQRGFDDFRSHDSALEMYVPSYASGAYRRNPKQIERMVKILEATLRNDRITGLLMDDHQGRLAAERDFLVYQAACVPETQPNIHRVSESRACNPFEQFEFDGRHFSRSFLRYLKGLAFLKQKTDTANLRSILEIGGGFGTAGEILLKSRPDSVYVDVDIPPVAAISSHYLREVFGPGAVWSYEDTRELDEIDINALPDGVRAVVLCPWQLPRLVGPLDLFINFVSFQEMEPDVVENYIRLVQPLTRDFVLMRNSRVGKQVVEKKNTDIGVLEPTTLDAMIASFDDFETLGRDAPIFGEQNKSGFVSEVVAMRRTSSAAL